MYVFIWFAFSRSFQTQMIKLEHDWNNLYLKRVSRDNPQYCSKRTSVLEFIFTDFTHALLPRKKIERKLRSGCWQSPWIREFNKF